MPEFVALGARLVAVSPQLSEHSRAVRQDKGLTLELLSLIGGVTYWYFKLK